MIERIDELRAQAEGAIASADSTAALEELRVRYLGRKAELPNLLRGVAQLAPEERGKVGRAANQARQALEGLIEARAGEPLRGPLEGTLVIGAERAGLPEEVVEACEVVAHIPIAGDSLNAAMAATIALYESTRVTAP